MGKEKAERLGRASLFKVYKRGKRGEWLTECIILSSKMCAVSILCLWTAIGILSFIRPETKISHLFETHTIIFLLRGILMAIVAPCCLSKYMEAKAALWLTASAVAFVGMEWLYKSNTVALFLGCTPLWLLPSFISEIQKLIGKGPEPICRQPTCEKFHVGDRDISIHESGHAIMATLLGIPVEEISLTKGHVTVQPIIFDKYGIQRLVMVLYGGIIAERIYRNDGRYISLSAKSDIREATECIYTYFAECGGMGSLVNWTIFKGGRMLTKECEKFSILCEEKATELMLENRECLDQTVKFLDGKARITRKSWEEFWISKVVEDGKV